MVSILPSLGRVLLIAALLFSPAFARKSEESRLLQTLTGTSESAKIRELEKLANRPKDRDTALPDLITAANTISDRPFKKDQTGLPTSTLALLDLLGNSVAEDATRTLCKLLQSDNTLIAMASAEALGRNNQTSTLVALRQQIKRPDYTTSYAFRFSLLKSIALLRSPEAVEFLCVTIPTLDGQLHHEVETFLDQVDASYFHGSQEKLKAWKNNTWLPLKASGYSSALPGTPESYRSEQYKKATYYGMPIYAKRVIFVIDRSPSMDEMVDGQSRLHRAILELSQAIEGLDPTTEFTVVLFDGRVKAWRKELVEASQKNKRNVIKFTRQHYRSSLTNTYTALRVALNIDDNTEAIYVISDGEPTTGSVTDPAEIVHEISQRNAFRYTKIHTIGLALTGVAKTFMQELAEQNGGEYRDTE